MCPISANLKTSKTNLHDLLVLQIIVILGLSQLKENVTKYKTEYNQGLSEMGFNENGQYCSNDYRTVYHLQTNFNKRDFKYRIKFGLDAIVIIKLLLQTEFFGSNINLNSSSTKEDIILTGSTVLTHLFSLACNAYEVVECQVNRKDFTDRDIKSIGSAVYGVCSLLNHSCDPAVARSSHGKRLAVFAVRSIDEGEDITDSYAYLYSTDSLTERRKALSSDYCFECMCKACINLWPLKSVMEMDPYVFCPYCKKHVNIRTHHCQDSEVEHAFDCILMKIQKFSFIFNDMNFGNLSSKTEHLACEIISALMEYDVLPCKIMFYCQDTLKWCRMLHGNHWDVVDNI